MNTRLLTAYQGSSAIAAGVFLTTTGTLQTRNSAGTVLATTTAVAPLNAWFRVELDVTGISGSTGAVAARLYSGANLETTTVDTGGSLSTGSTSVGGLVNEFRFGAIGTVFTSAITGALKQNAPNLFGAILE